MIFWLIFCLYCYEWGRRLFQHYPQTGHYVHNAICIHLSKSCVYYVCCLYAFLCFGFQKWNLAVIWLIAIASSACRKWPKCSKRRSKYYPMGQRTEQLRYIRLFCVIFPAKAKKTSLSLNKSIATPFFSTNCAKYLRHTKARKNSSSLPLVARKSHTKC